MSSSAGGRSPPPRRTGWKSSVFAGTSERGVKPLDWPPPARCPRRGHRGTARSRRRCRPPGACRRPRSPTRATPGGRRSRRAALAEVRAQFLALGAPDGDVEVVGLVLPVAARTLGGVAGDPQLADRRAAGQVAQLGIGREVPREDHSVDVCRGHLRPPPSGTNESCGESRAGIGRQKAPSPLLARFCHRVARKSADLTPGRRLQRRDCATRRRRRALRRAQEPRTRPPRRCPWGAARDGSRGAPGARRELDDAKAHDAVGDLQRALQRLEHVARAVELQQVVLGVGLVPDLVRGLAHAPVLAVDDLATGGDGGLDAGAHLRALVFGRRAVEHQNEVVKGIMCGHAAAHDSEQ